jgi:hypothetical protein
MTVALQAPSAPWTIGTEELARILGVAADTLPAGTRRVLAAADFSFTPLAGAELRAVEDRVRDALAAPLPVSGPARQPVWEAGWGDILARFARSGDVADLEPH